MNVIGTFRRAMTTELIHIVWIEFFPLFWKIHNLNFLGLIVWILSPWSKILQTQRSIGFHSQGLLFVGSGTQCIGQKLITSTYLTNQISEFETVKNVMGTKGTIFFISPVENPFRSFYYLWEKAAARITLLLQTSMGNGTQSSINNGLNIYGFKGKSFWCYYFSSLLGERERMGSNQTYFRLTKSDLSVVSNQGCDTEVIHTSTLLRCFIVKKI